MSSDSPDAGEAQQEVQADISAALLTSVPASSREQMLEHGTRFVKFVHSKNANANLKVMDARAVNEYLRFFYFTLETKQGRRYSPASLICIRAGIQRYFELVLGRKITLPGNPVFMTSNRMMEQRAQEFTEGGGNAKHYRQITEEDARLLGEYFNGASPGPHSMEERLQDEILFSVLYHFGAGQHQHLRPLQRDVLILSVDTEGREFASLTPSAAAELSRTGGAESIRMYGLAKLKAYLGLLPERTMDNCMFPKPMRPGHGYSGCCNRGINYTQNFMRNLSKKALLNQLYSNHSIRLTRIRDLDSSGCSALEIRSVTGHRCDKSVKRCLRWGREAAAADASLADSNDGESEAAEGPTGDI